MAELVEATGGLRKARWLRREVAELVEATGGVARGGWLRREVAEPSKPPGGGRVGEVAEPVEATGATAAPGPSTGSGTSVTRVPVPSTGSGTSVTAGPGPFGRLRDLCHCGSRSLRQAQGPLSPRVRSLRQAQGPLSRGSRSLRRVRASARAASALHNAAGRTSRPGYPRSVPVLAALSDWLDRWIRREKARIAVIVVAAVLLAGCTVGEPDAATPTPVEMTALPRPRRPRPPTPTSNATKRRCR